MTGIPIYRHPTKGISQRQNKHSILLASNILVENRKDNTKKADRLLADNTEGKMSGYCHIKRTQQPDIIFLHSYNGKILWIPPHLTEQFAHSCLIPVMLKGRKDAWTTNPIFHRRHCNCKGNFSTYFFQGVHRRNQTSLIHVRLGNT